MNPCIDFSGVLRPEDSLDPSVQVVRLYAESQARTAVAKRRTEEMEAEYDQLYNAYVLARKLNQRFKMIVLKHKLDINRDLRETLYREWANRI
jgi:hypothetical protein